MPDNMLQNPGLTMVPTYPGITLLSGASIGTDDAGNPCIVFTSEGAGAMGMQRVMLALDPERFPDGTEVGRTYRAEINVLELSDGAMIQLFVGGDAPLNITEAGPVAFDFTAVSSVPFIRIAHNGSGPIAAKFNMPSLTD